MATSMDTSAAISRIMQAAGIKTQRELAILLEVPEQSISDYKKKDSLPASWLIRLCGSHQINPNWIQTGVGPTFVGEASGGQTNSKTDAVAAPPLVSSPSASVQDTLSDCAESPLAVSFPVRPDPEKYDWIPMVEAKLSAGGGSFENGETIRDYYAFRKRFIQRMACCAKNLVLLRVTGDSMTPDIQDGATVMLDLGRTSIKNGCIFALGVEDTILIKELERLADGRVRIISKNRAEYPPYETNAQNLRIIGQVIWGDRRFPL